MPMWVALFRTDTPQPQLLAYRIRAASQSEAIRKALTLAQSRRNRWLRGGVPLHAAPQVHQLNRFRVGIPLAQSRASQH
ncbi:MAG TPA: hypothetical protein VN520_38070 [Streptomyces sp.]|uniref:hypothetical protein n=1 Tax=Streptomyces sp. TaxID=1931 RepID=UPI002B6F9E72|nr:hypothetical protein [Streptomyces sp.]HWU12089.1 hypothetical protein [Streptomyces sp.]